MSPGVAVPSAIFFLSTTISVMPPMVIGGASGRIGSIVGSAIAAYIGPPVALLRGVEATWPQLRISRSWLAPIFDQWIACSKAVPQNSRSDLTAFIIAHLPVVPLEQDT